MTATTASPPPAAFPTAPPAKIPLPARAVRPTINSVPTKPDAFLSATTPTVSPASNPVSAALVWMDMKLRTASVCWTVLKVWWLIAKSVSLWPLARTVILVSCWPTVVLPAS